MHTFHTQLQCNDVDDLGQRFVLETSFVRFSL